MHPDEIETQRRQRPFMPFRIHMSDGSYYDVRHPEMALITRRVISIAIYEGGDVSMPERAVFCDPVHVTRLEPLNGKTTDAVRDQSS